MIALLRATPKPPTAEQRHAVTSAEPLREDLLKSMEERLSSGKVSDTRMAAELRSLSPAEASALGSYIGRCLDPDSFLQCFHTCFPHIRDCNPMEADYFVRRFVHQEPN